MKLQTKMLLIAALFALVLPLVFTGTASARFMEDGATPNPAGGWNIPTDFVCVLGVAADGTITTAPPTNRRDCQYYTTGLTGMNPVDVTSSTMCGPLGTLTCASSTNCTGTSQVTKGTLTWNATDSKCYDSAPCTVAGFALGTYGGVSFPTANTGGKHGLATSICTGVSLSGLDRNANMCLANSGTWKQTSATAPSGVSGTFPTAGFGGACVAFGAQFKGQNASGTPLAFGAEGTTQVIGTTGYCYLPMDWTPVYSTATCPSLKSTVSPFDANAAYDWSVASSQCRYSKSVAGKIYSDLYQANGTKIASGTYVDLSGIITMGDCLAYGGSWNNWTGSAALTTAVGSDSNTYKRPNWDYTRQAPDADTGCLHCHSTTMQYNGPAERFKDSYVKTGHKNMLRKVIPGNNLTDADGNVYTTDGTVTINFTTATVTGGKKLFYIYGDWMIPAPTLVYETTAGNNTSVYTCGACHTAGYKDATTSISGIGAATIPGVLSIGNTASGYTGVQPQESFPLLSLGTLNPKWDLEGIQCGRCHNAAVGPINATQIAASSYPSTHTLGGGMGSLANGVGRTNLCFGCHQAIDKIWPAGTTNVNDPTIIPTGTGHGATWGRDWNGHVIGNSFLNSAHGKFTGTIVRNALGKYDIYDLSGNDDGKASLYTSAFTGYTCWQGSTTNSPAKTKANGSEIENKTECEALYGAGSWRNDTGTPGVGTKGTCSTCHDVHNSLFVDSQKEAALRKTCEKCHTDNTPANGYTVASAPQVTPTTINHPTSGNTPWDTSKYESACVVCHMAQQAEDDEYNTLSLPGHLWRINTDASYSTFPSIGQFYGGTCSVHNGAVQNNNSVPKVYLSDTTSALCIAGGGAWTPVTKTRSAQTAPDGTYANAVWIDLDLACGQCHGGGTNPTTNPPADGVIHYFSKDTLSGLAADMHDNRPTADFTVGYGANYLTANVNGSASVCPVGPCSYDWNWNDATAHGTGVSTSHAYATAGGKTITLTVTDTGSGFTATKSKPFNAYLTNVPPVAACTGGITCNLNTWTASCIDASTDTPPGTVIKRSMTWGDGSFINTCTTACTFTHTYINPGFYGVTLTAFDNNMATGTLAGSCNPAYFTISGLVKSSVASGAISLSGATVVVKNSVTNATVSTTVTAPTTGAFSTGAVLKPGTYNIYVTKAGYSFTPPAATKTVGPNQTGFTINAL